MPYDPRRPTYNPRIRTYDPASRAYRKAVQSGREYTDEEHAQLADVSRRRRLILDAGGGGAGPDLEPTNTANIQLLTAFEATPPVDESNTGRTLTLNGSASVGATNPKFGANSLILTGASPKSCSAAADAAMCQIDADYNVDAWIYLSTLGTGRVGIVTNRLTGTQHNWALWTTGGATQYLNVFGWNSNLTILDHIGTTALAAGQWYHVAWSYEYSTRTSQLWLDGVDQGTAVASNDISYSGALLQMGRDDTSASRYLDGYMDEVRIVKGELLGRFGNGNFDVPTVAWGRP